MQDSPAAERLAGCIRLHAAGWTRGTQEANFQTTTPGSRQIMAQPSNGREMVSVCSTLH